MGWENKFHCEWNEFGQKVLKYYWPNAESFGDITKTDFKKYNGTINVISGGFPCQPYSQAGKRKGKEDDRHLWPEMLRAIREIQPRWVVGENVRGLTNWNGGVVFDEVQADLEVEGYEITPFLLPACAVNAPHRRDRIWFVAYCNSNGFNGCDSQYEVNSNIARKYAQHDTCKIYKRDASNSHIGGQQGPGEFQQPLYTKESGNREINRAFYDSKQCNVANNASEGLERRKWANISSEYSRGKSEGWNENWYEALTRIWSLPNGLSGRLDTSAISKSEWRKESLKAYGNAIVPQVAYQIFKTIQDYENIQK